MAYSAYSIHPSIIEKLLIFVVVIIGIPLFFGFCMYKSSNKLNQLNNHLNHLLAIKQAIQQNLQKTDNLSYKQYKQKLRHHQLVAYQKVFNSNKNQYYAVFYSKSHKKYTVNMINYNNKSHFSGYKKLNYYNKLIKPPKYNKPSLGKVEKEKNIKNYTNWFCGNQKSIKHFLGSETFNNLKVKQNKICQS